MVDKFGVKYVGKEHAFHLKQALEENYKVTIEWDGTRYIGITLDWDYKWRQVHLYLSGYTNKTLKQFILMWSRTKSYGWLTGYIT